LGDDLKLSLEQSNNTTRQHWLLSRQHTNSTVALLLDERGLRC
jgi:hypothetical protein